MKAQAEQFPLEFQNGCWKGRSCTDPLSRTKLLTEKRREFNLETHLAFLDYVKVYDKVERDRSFEILQNKNIPNL